MHGVSVNIFGEINPLILIGYQNVFISTLEDCPRVVITIVVVHSISDRYASHEIGDSELLRELF